MTTDTYRASLARMAETCAFWRAQAIQDLNADMMRTDGRHERPGYYGAQIRRHEDDIVRFANDIIHGSAQA